MLSSKELVKLAAEALDSKKGLKIRAIGISNISILADYFVIAAGTSNTHINALADEVEFKIGQAGEKPRHVEGDGSAGWILLDYGCVVVHVFQEKTREFYDLERLWQDGEPIDISEFLPNENI